MKTKQTMTGTGATLIALMFVPCFGAAAPGETMRIENAHLKGGAQFGVTDKVYTREEMRSAKPIEWTPAEGFDARYASDPNFREQAPQSTGTPQSGEPGAPHPNARRDAQRDFAEEWQLLNDEAQESGASAAGASGPVNFGSANIYTSYRGNFWDAQHLAPPWNVVGKLLIDGVGYCTAQSISGAPKNLIVTAAHCVFDRFSGRFYSGWTFVPAERNGVAPYGQFRWSSAVILSSWVTIGGRQQDVALISLGNNAVGQPVSFYTGWLGWRQDFPYEASLHSIGYASNFSTQWTTVCAAESFFASCEGINVLVKGCNMTFGSSGGGWIELYRAHELTGYVEGVVSGPSCAGAFGQTFVGPRFSATNFGALCSAYAGCTN